MDSPTFSIPDGNPAGNPSGRRSGSPTVAIQTHGCKLNQADSNQLARQFIQAGYRLVDSMAKADVYVLNTCTVTATADAKARQALRAARRRNPQAFIVATGCYSQRAADELNRMAAVSLVVPNTQKDDLVNLVSSTLSTISSTISPAISPATAPVQANPDLNQNLLPFGGIRPGTNAISSAGRVRATIKIQEGCDQVCAYCIVPKVRGRERSIPPDALVAQVNLQVAEGVKEIVLTGTQLGTYGFDIAGTNLVAMLRRLLQETQAARLRVSSLQAHEISPELLDLWQDSRLCPHFHVPLQSGSDRILKAMRRRYDTQQFAHTINLIRTKVPDAAITTDIIVGFPGESEAQFQESLNFASSMAFSDTHVFPYSPRPGTSAAHLADTVTKQEKRDRVGAIQAMSRQHFLEFRASQLGQVRPVLWGTSRKRDGESVHIGLTDNYIRVSAEYPSDLRNTITPARLIETLGDTVFAQVLFRRDALASA